MKKIHTLVAGTKRTLCGRKIVGTVPNNVGKSPPDDAEYCESCTALMRGVLDSHPDSKTDFLVAIHPDFPPPPSRPSSRQSRRPRTWADSRLLRNPLPGRRSTSATR
jgi:hypothetical protein